MSSPNVILVEEPIPEQIELPSTSASAYQQRFGQTEYSTPDPSEVGSIASEFTNPFAEKKEADITKETEGLWGVVSKDLGKKTEVSMLEPEISEIESIPPEEAGRIGNLVESIGGKPAVAMIGATIGSAVIGGLPYLAYEIVKDVKNYFSSDKKEDKREPVIIHNVFKPTMEQKVSQKVETEQKQTQRQVGRELKIFKRKSRK